MKKIVAFAVSLVLLLCGFAFQRENDTRNVIIELGSKQSERVTTVKTLAEVLESLTSRFHDTVYTSAKGESKIEGVSENVPVSEEDQRAKYTDAKLTFETHGTIAFDAEYRLGFEYVSTSSKMTFDRSMTCLFTEDAAYYHIDAEIRQSASADSETSKSFISLEEELYITEETTLMRIAEMTVLAEGNYVDMKDLLGKWIDCGGNGTELANSVNTQNYKQLALIGDYIDDREGDGFVKKGGLYTLKETPCKELCMQLFALAGAGALPESCLQASQFSVDLSTAITPIIGLSYTIKHKEEYKEVYQEEYKEIYEEGSVKCSGVENTRITVTDINRGNKVKLPESAEIYDINDFDDLI